MRVKRWSWMFAAFGFLFLGGSSLADNGFRWGSVGEVVSTISAAVCIVIGIVGVFLSFREVREKRPASRLDD